jgi:hypothetical protein
MTRSCFGLSGVSGFSPSVCGAGFPASVFGLGFRLFLGSFFLLSARRFGLASGCWLWFWASPSSSSSAFRRAFLFRLTMY